MNKEELLSRYINGELHANELIEIIVEQDKKIKAYEEYFEENSVESIQNKMDTYGEAMLESMREE